MTMFVVTLPSSASTQPRSFAADAKKAGANVLEIRSDLTPVVPAFTSPLPILLSIRGSEAALLDVLKPEYIDLEASSEALDSLRSRCGKKSKLILSEHNYEKTPSLEELQAKVSSMLASKPWAVKIATKVVTYDDLITLHLLQDWLRKKNVRSIVLGMGEKAHCSRLLSPLRNVMTFSSLDGHEASTVGQLPLSLYRLTKGRKAPKIFGILGGKQILSSLSPVIHNALFQKHKIDALYSCFPTEQFKRTVKTLKKFGLTGLSVTAPFKGDAFQFSKKHDPSVDALGVANTLVKSGKGWKGFNTDVAGIEYGYPELKKATMVSILGAGGVVPSAIAAVRRSNPKAHITVFARDKKKASHALKKFHVAIEPLASVLFSKADAVLCTVTQDVSLPLPLPASKSSFAIDLRYGKRTAFLQDAEKKGYRVRDGVPMLLHQALRQFECFTGKKTSPVDIAYLQSVLKSFIS